MMVQILGNRRFAYDFKTTDWMGKYFFAGGTMPSRDLFEYFLPADLTQSRVWDVDGRQYSRTLDAWLQRLDDNKDECLQALEGGPTSASSRAGTLADVPVVLLGGLRLPRRQRVDGVPLPVREDPGASVIRVGRVPLV